MGHRDGVGVGGLCGGGTITLAIFHHFGHPVATKNNGDFSATYKKLG